MAGTRDWWGRGGTPPLGDEGFCRAPRLSFLTGVVHMSVELVPGLGARQDVGRGLGLMGCCRWGKPHKRAHSLQGLVCCFFFQMLLICNLLSTNLASWLKVNLFQITRARARVSKIVSLCCWSWNRQRYSSWGESLAVSKCLCITRSSSNKQTHERCDNILVPRSNDMFRLYSGYLYL